MSRKSKVVALVTGSILVIGFLVWYYYPVLVFRLQRDKSFGNLKSYHGVTPELIVTLKSPPQEWMNLHIGDLTIRLPMLRYDKVSGDEANIWFVSGAGPTFIIGDIVPSRAMVESEKIGKIKTHSFSYEERLAIFNSSPADISIFHSRNKNMTALVNLTLKAIYFHPGGIGKILAVNTGTLKALCVLSERKYKNGYVAWAEVYSPNEAVHFSLMLKGYGDQAALEGDLLTILGGIRMPDHKLDPSEVSKDIASIVNNWAGKRNVHKEDQNRKGSGQGK
ncbi:MAG TPA: hypothetical protein VEF33_02870 [Syntrophales bacterium]|nr:hypothetical protein [Syntrophales bacterium]